MTTTATTMAPAEVCAAGEPEPARDVPAQGPYGFRGGLPRLGSVVALSPGSVPLFEFRDRVVWLRLSAAPEVSTVDLLAGRTLWNADRILLSGWEIPVGARAHLARHHTRLWVRRTGIEVTPGDAD